MTHWNTTDLSEPPALAKDTLRVIPLGGLGEVPINLQIHRFNRHREVSLGRFELPASRKCVTTT